jgi:predicted nuclease of predicted toxin-antitoxin system
VKLLFDQNLSYRLCAGLADVIAQSAQVRQLGLDQADDRVIWEYARREGFAIVTLDVDFADLAALRGAPPKVIWLRCGNQPTTVVERLIRDHAPAIARFLEDDEAACLELY